MNELEDALSVIENMTRKPTKLASNDCLDYKIIQLVVTPNDSVWQGRLFGLGSDGITYEATNDGWVLFFDGIKPAEF